MKYLSVLIIFITLFSNCNSTYGVNSKNKETKNQATLSGTYMVTTLYGEDVSEYNLTLEFDTNKKTISGFSGCNSYSCSYNVDGKSLITGFPIGTKMYCEKTSELEKKFFKIFSEEKSRILKNYTLNLVNSKNENILSAKKSE